MTHIPTIWDASCKQFFDIACNADWQLLLRTMRDLDLSDRNYTIETEGDNVTIQWYT